ncbi:MAG: GNAT family N-acetyltransferase, partial [Gammaproteobacteria bacterium]|nr:GNAT family N-acetyltransferase [Gammaproteobacteria bacterium]
ALFYAHFYAVINTAVAGMTAAPAPPDTGAFARMLDAFVTLVDGVVAGGAGLFPTPGLPPGTCELVKMYLLPAARGKGLGKELLQRVFQLAKDLGYGRMYLETMPELKTAIGMYEKMGFGYLDAPKGCSGHGGCDIWMEKAL